MKNKNEEKQKALIYKFINYTDSEVINKIKQIEKLKNKTKKITYMGLFI